MSVRKKRQPEPQAQVPENVPTKAPPKPVVEVLPKRYQLNTVMTRYGFSGEPYSPAVLTEVEAVELLTGLIEAIYVPKEA